MSGYFNFRMFEYELENEIAHGKNLGLCASVFGFLAISCQATGIDNMNTHCVDPGNTIGDFPGINNIVVIVGHQLFDGTIQMDEVGIANLLPPSACRRRIEMPVPDLIRCNFAELACSCAVDNEIFDIL